MKKGMILFLLAGILFLIGGCSFSFTTTTPQTTTFLTSGTSTTTTLDIDQIKSDVYAKIYADLYDEIKAEVVQDISEERFDQIYESVISALLVKIESGEIEVSAASVIDMIYDVASTDANAVVGVSNYNSSGTVQSIGSGVIYKHVGTTYFVVTNNHVVEDGVTYEIQFEDDTTEDAVVLGVDTLVDLAVLSFTSDTLYTITSFGDSDALDQGTIVLAVGNPSGYDYFGSMTMGIVSGTSRYFDIDNDSVKDMFVGYVQHDASINAGNSGGALFNLQGEVVGINVIKIADVTVEGMGFAIPSNLVVDVCADIEEFGVSLQKPVLGIEFVDISTGRDYLISLGATIPSSITTGFYVNAIVAGSSVDGYVLPGDIIQKIGDVDVTSTADFVLGFSKYRVGDVIDIILYRNGQTLTISDVELKPKV
ncbi:MAG: trypsin-like peptidase domain-containing protein [Firmicutes bacterium]|nr:trypsin-like peptidase domain-containing protein [Bacillota bacterium]